MPETGGASGAPKKGLTLDYLIAAIDQHERNPSNIPKVDTFHFCGERVSEWLERVEQALVGRSDIVKFQCILQYVIHSYHQEVKKVIDPAQGSWERFKEGMRRKYRLGDGLLTTADLEAMNKEDFTTIGAFVQEFKKRARKVHGISEEAQCAIFLGLLTASEAVELTRHGGGSTKLTWATIDREVEVGCLDQVEQRQAQPVAPPPSPAPSSQGSVAGGGNQGQGNQGNGGRGGGRGRCTNGGGRGRQRNGQGQRYQGQGNQGQGYQGQGNQGQGYQGQGFQGQGYQGQGNQGQGYQGQGYQGQVDLGSQGYGRPRFDWRTAIYQHCDQQGHTIRFCNVRREDERSGLISSTMDGNIYDQFGEAIDRRLGGVRAEAQRRAAFGPPPPAMFRLWQEKEEPPIGVEEVGSNEEVAQGLQGGSKKEEPVIIELDDEKKEERMEPPSVLCGKMEALLDKMGRYQQKLVGLCEEVTRWRSNILKVFLYDSSLESAPRRPGVNVVGSCPQSGMMGRPLTPQAWLAQAARTRNQARVSANQEPPRREPEPGKRKEAVEVEDDDDEEEEDERLRQEEDQRAEQRARKKGARGEAEPIIRDGPTKKKKYVVRLEEGFDVEKVIDRLLEGHNDLMTLKEILASAPRLRDELKGRLSRRLVPNVHLGTILPKEAEWAESGTKMDWKNTGPRSIRNWPNPGSFTIKESEGERRRLQAEPEAGQRVEAFSLSLSDVGKAMDLVAAHEMADPDAIQALREQVLECPEAGRLELVYRLPGSGRHPASAQTQSESLGQSSSLNPAGNVDEVPESQDDEFEEGEIKEAFRAEEYDGINLELGLLLSCEMRLRDASNRAQRMLQRHLVRDGHLFVRREVGNPRRVVCVESVASGEEHGEQAEEVPREEVPRVEVPREEVPREEVPREEVLQEEVLRKEVQGTQRERGLGDEGRRAGKEVIEVGEDTPPHTPAVGLRLGDAPGSTRQAGERLQREEAPLPLSKKAPSPEDRAERRRERAAVRKEALTLIDRHLAAYALEHPDLGEPAPAEPHQEPCQLEKEMEAEIPKRVDLRTRERASAGETAEEKRARRTRRIDEIWQERQRLEAAREIQEQQQERQRSEAAGALPGQPPSVPARAPEIPEMWRDFWERRGEEFPSPVRAGFGVARKAEERLDRKNKFLAKTTFDRHLLLESDLAGRKMKEASHGIRLEAMEVEIQELKEPPMGRVILEPEEARAQRRAEREAFEFRAPTELATLPVAAASPVVHLALEERMPPSSSEPAQGSVEGSMSVLLEAVHTMQEEVSLFSPQRRIEEPLEREIGIEAEGAIERGLQRMGMPEYGPEEIEEQSMTVPGETLERRPQRLDTPEYVPVTENLRSRMGSWATGSGFGGLVPAVEQQEVVSTVTPRLEQQGVVSTLVGAPSSPLPQPKKKKFKRKVAQLCFYCKRGVHLALDCLEFLEDKAEGKVSDAGGKMCDRQGRIVEKSADGLRAQLYRQNQEELKR
ncbi:hypothetical protein CBR_g37187 [Chara braunii]|uniref:Retrotransposon gag domain-containing protein n=1 Tax=Chara braunii TaxID=69332 RepID=A0A388LMM5_CHABU|nr:hypothetical protein CBR_g37187 [Chara braunii]|eukprot:GBG83475.1 hypothetical protein CBR_g37187 [Chara braunii]